jgi:hypothetical protein
VSSRARPPSGNGDPTYPIDVGAEIERQSTVKAVRKRLRKRMKAGERPPAKPKLVWTANFEALDGAIGGVGGGQLRRLRRVRFPD